MVEPNAGNGVTQAKDQTHHNTEEKLVLPTPPAVIPANVPAGGCSPGQCQFAAVPFHNGVQLPGVTLAEPSRSRRKQQQFKPAAQENTSSQSRTRPCPHRAPCLLLWDSEKNPREFNKGDKWL